MQNYLKTVGDKLQLFVKYLILKFKKTNSAPNHLQFYDFFTCEEFTKKIGYSFLGNTPNKWLRINGILIQLALILMAPVFITSITLSIQEGFLYYVIENVLISAVLSFTLVKIFMVFHKKRTLILAIARKLEKHFPHSEIEQLMYNAYDYLMTVKKMNFPYKLLLYSTMPYFCLMPILHQMYAAYMSIYLEWETIFTLNLGFNLLQPGVYELVNMILSWIIIFGVCFVFCTDLLFSNLVQILAMELDILGSVIGNLNYNKNDEEALKEFKKFVDIHQELIEVSENLNEIFSPILLINCAGSIVSLCTAFFLSVSGISGYFIAKYLFLPVIITVQIFLQCYFSQQLKDSASGVAVSAYNLEWYNRSVKFQKYVLMIMIRAQKPQSVTAWKFFDVSLETFQWIIKTSYSYFSILKGMYGA